jgi:thioredoxin 1
MSESVIQVTDGNFEQEVLKSELPTLVDFWAPWCGPCKAIGPVVEELALQYKDKLKVAKLNIDDNPKMPVTYGIRGVPTLILFKDGKVLETLVGLAPKDRLESLIKKAF